MFQNNVELEVLIKGRPVTEYRHRGQTFIEGREGSEFEVLIRNRTGRRVEAVVSVDGLSVLDGKEAGTESSGYLVEAHGSVSIPGWTLDNARVAKFQFSGKEGSYAAAATGSARNTGVIGLLAYNEVPAIRTPSYYTKSADPFGGGGFGGGWAGSDRWNDIRIGSTLRGSGMTYGASMSDERARGIAPTNTVMLQGIATNHVDATPFNAVALNNLGTGFGEAADFRTTQVSFQRGDLHSMLVLMYDNARGLKARGIDLRLARKTISQEPDPFPGMRKGCVPPPGWRG